MLMSTRRLGSENTYVQLNTLSLFILWPPQLVGIGLLVAALESCTAYDW